MTEDLPKSESVVADTDVPDANVAIDEEGLSITTDNNTGQEESNTLPEELQAQTTSIEEPVEVEAVGPAPTEPPELDVATDPIPPNTNFDDTIITDAAAAAAAGSAVDAAVTAAVTAHVGDILYNAIDSTAVVNVATNDSLPSAEYFVGTGNDTQQNGTEGEPTITTPTNMTTAEQQQQPSLLPPQQHPSHEEQSTTAMTSAVELVITKTGEKEHNVEIDGAMIAEAAAAAVAAVGDVQLAVDAALAAERNDEGAAAAVAAVAAAAQATEAENTTNTAFEVDAETKKSEQRRKRYHESLKSIEEGDSPPAKKQATTQQSHEDQLASRRLKDRQRYASMNPEQRQIYNSKRRDQYHRQSENSRQRRRERERERYHSLENEDAKKRNTRRAKLERERYQRLTPDNLEAKNSRRRERAASARVKKAIERNNEGTANAADDSPADDLPADDLPGDTTTNAIPTTVVPPTDTTTTTTVAPPATAGSNASTVTGEVKAEENFGNSIHNEEQTQGNANEMVFAANEVEKAVVEVAVEVAENHHVSV